MPIAHFDIIHLQFVYLIHCFIYILITAFITIDIFVQYIMSIVYILNYIFNLIIEKIVMCCTVMFIVQTVRDQYRVTLFIRVSIYCYNNYYYMSNCSF